MLFHSSAVCGGCTIHPTDPHSAGRSLVIKTSARARGPSEGPGSQGPAQQGYSERCNWSQSAQPGWPASTAYACVSRPTSRYAKRVPGLSTFLGNKQQSLCPWQQHTVPHVTCQRQLSCAPCQLACGCPSTLRSRFRRLNTLKLHSKAATCPRSVLLAAVLDRFGLQHRLFGPGYDPTPCILPWFCNLTLC